ncbi:MFS transporter [Catenulispora sp. NF23]|uniref:MFS transporter n=1 Tax=Catenulispora pinistramenti TaxID=2705254 RepID=A0ABS5KYG7_9ACTN|nr:MFS transporter [Catenulispora pinistramenti]MBS2534659.1 MFS transporter [Catenulispora pinistramenti]MBS2551088.1 MFS transporter [Catenulispora pinistramenti]
MGLRRSQSANGGIGAGGTGRRTGAAPAAADAPKRTGTLAQLRNPPGGQDSRRMLAALFLDRAGNGVWNSALVLYFTVVAHLSAGRIGLLLGIAGLVGIAGPPIAGHLAERLPVRTILVACHLIRVLTLCSVPLCHGFVPLLAVTTATTLCDRGSKTMEIVFAGQTAGAQRATYRALSRVVMNAAYALGAGIAAIAVAVGTGTMYEAVVVGNGVSYLAVAALVLRTSRRAPVAATPAAAGSQSGESDGGPKKARGRNPWRDPGYLLFVLLDVFLNLDDAILTVGVPLWALTRTHAPHAVIPAVMVINTLMCVFLQMSVSARVSGARAAARAACWYGVALLAGCALLAVSGQGGALLATITLVLAAVVLTTAELVRSLVSWELAVSLAPTDAQASYLGVAGMAQALERSAGPVALSSGVLAAGPVGWLGLGAVVTGLGVVQRVASLRRLDRKAAGEGGAAAAGGAATAVA